jgi:DNA modification methylase
VQFSGNHLLYGDNLDLMQAMQAKSVDLIYLDPPFKSDQNYNLMYRTLTGRPVPEQQRAFSDTWEMDAQKVELAKSMPMLMRSHGISDDYVKFWETWTRALRDVQPQLLAYLIYMFPRLLQMRVLLRDHGTIYLHCDPTASHYIKVMMDGIFGHQNFRNEIAWQRSTAKGHAFTRFPTSQDTILVYGKTDKVTWNPVYVPHRPEYIESHYKKIEPETGRRYTLGDCLNPNPDRPNLKYEWQGITRTWRWTKAKMQANHDAGRLIYTASGMPRYKRYLDEMPGTPVTSVWTDISPVNSQAQDRLGYPTQKPIPLLKRIIEASSNPGDVIFDPFCGCGTTIYAAQETGRRWIGCDIAILAVRLIREVLSERYRLVEGTGFFVDGIPVSLEQAEQLAEKNKVQFQNWAAERVGGFPNTKKSGDLGVDGKIWFETKKGLQAMALSVKGGAIKPADIRDLRGVLEREGDCPLAGFISLKEPTKAMREEAAMAGEYMYNDVAYPRIQLLSVRDILEDGRAFLTPTKMGTKLSTGQGALPI